MVVPFSALCGCLNGVRSRNKKELKKSHLKAFIDVNDYNIAMEAK
jgi:hypothetical protein